MAQWLRAPTAFPEVVSSIPSNHIMTQQPSVIGFDALFWCV
jgi:ABC-type enterochelin transport system permease subunit